ncbi:Ig-like domain repeat protein [Streptomyces sioyaensis]|uniref:Ig-like domain repeat protein n=1 Tax=Streptomyces sioyaensis TaxID=67364 RepID=UPI0037A86885
MALTLTLTPATVTAGGTFTASVTGAAAGETITFTYDAALPVVATADGAGNASATFTATTSGPVVAAGPTSGAATAQLTVTQLANCVVTLTSTPLNPVAGQPVTVTATVTCGGVPVTGATVLFTSVSGPLGVGVTTPAGAATLTTSLLPAGSTVVTATVLAASTTCTCVGVAATTTVVVTPAPSCVVTLASTPANPTVGQPVTLTATVTCGGVPVTGALVLFTTTSGPVGVGVTGATGTASLVTTLLPVGSTVVTATVLAGTSTCTCVGVSATTTVNVGGVGAGTLTALPACYRLDLATLSAHATFTATGATPGSTVTFHLGTGPSGPVACTAVADAGGTATCNATLSLFQLLFVTYTATSGTQASTSTLGPCLS